jgi:hypothetical protein
MRLRSIIAAVLTTAAITTVGAGPLLLVPRAGAQEGGGVITLEAAHPAGTSVHFIVRVTWENDGRPATGAAVTATAMASDGTRLMPVTLAPIDEDGRYANAIDFGSPGSWTVRFTSVDPAGTADVTQTVDAATEGDDATAGGGGDGGFAPADDNTGASGEASAGDGDDGGMPLWLVGAAAVVVFGGAVLGMRTVRRYRSEAATEEAQFERLDAARGEAKPADAPGATAPGPKARE